jgi:hypothetical protein
MDFDTLVKRWERTGAEERANKDSFLINLCAALNVDPPTPKATEGVLDDYCFEFDVPLQREGIRSVGKIDLFKRGQFALEAKQGSWPGAEKVGSARRNTPAYALMMDAARGQLLGYMRELEEPPPFLLVCDIGYCIDVYACFDDSRSWRPFPTARESRIYFKDLAAAPAQIERLQKIWTDARSLDPSRIALEVTQEVASHLARLAKSLSAPERKFEKREIARFLMRCLFTMFAEDIGLLANKVFEHHLDGWIERPDTFVYGAEALWKAMNEGGGDAWAGKILRFNGGLFKDGRALPLQKLELLILKEAAMCDWSKVEPAIFGTLLENSLLVKERKALGAHFTPRAYVERLVRPCVEEPLRTEWNEARTKAWALIQLAQQPPPVKKGKKPRDFNAEARHEVEEFLHKLSQLQILDPACGTGNFLYVTLDLMKRLEGEAVEFLNRLFETGKQEQAPLSMEAYSVHPRQFRGIEVNAFAKEIAEMVLWIGYLQWHFRVRGKVLPPEPVLTDDQNIECRDAVLEWEFERPRIGEDGLPITHWDGETYRLHPVTYERIPDERAQVAVNEYVNPAVARWPRADYIVGNPPFIGNKRMRDLLGDGYVEALRAAHKDVSQTADFVMYWWNQAAKATASGKVKRFGLITTNSITQVFNRKVVERALEAKKPVSLIFAIPDHPWVDEESGAAVRIAMTVGEAGKKEGRLQTIISEGKPDKDSAVELVLHQAIGTIHADLSVGTAVTKAVRLLANSSLSFMGVTLSGQGFVVAPNDPLASLHDECLHTYLTGGEFTRRRQDRKVIDFYGLRIDEARARHPRLFQRIVEAVKPERDLNNRPLYRERWWLFAEDRPGLREAQKGLDRYIATCRTAVHRTFEFIPGTAVVESTVIAIALCDAFFLGALSSRAHLVWTLRLGGTLEDRPRYNNTLTFEPFPFPVCTAAQVAAIRTLGEQLDSFRKGQQAAHPKLTLTGMYNVLAKLRVGEPLDEKEQAIHEVGLVSVLKQIHDELDAAVLDAYGWPRGLSDTQIVERLVALNAERAAEEKKGKVRWLRPEFQAPDSAEARAAEATRAKKAKQTSLLGVEAEAELALDEKRWPEDLAGRMLSVNDVLRGSASRTLEEVLGEFAGTGAKAAEVLQSLESLRMLGRVLRFADEQRRERWVATRR